MSSVNDYIQQVVTLADVRGYDIVDVHADGSVRLRPRDRALVGDNTIEFTGLFLLDTMRRCLIDLTEKAA